MTVRKASAQWTDGLKDGTGTMKLGSGAFEGPYSFATRFEDEQGTNPEELIAAAHAGCFSMALAARLEKAGHSPGHIETTAAVQLDQGHDAIDISRIELSTRAKVSDLTESEFSQIAEEAKANCPVSKALRSTDITLDATLTGE